MLFNSIIFIFWFLPFIVIGFFIIGHYHRKAAAVWLVLGAFFFYGYWNVKDLVLLVVSIILNYTYGYFLSILKNQEKTKSAKLLFILSIVTNLVILGYYKYSNFFLSQFNLITGTHYYLQHMLLPLGISFFTFTQIAFLVDIYQKKSKEYDLVYYFLFVTYFPHLIAGPIIHHAEMMPQFLSAKTYKFCKNNLTIGLLIFVIGLAKKVLLADHLAFYADQAFATVSTTHSLSFLDSWGGALAYTFQLYFDFSGYCDMAIGISRMLNIKLPINFNSPYKSLNIIEFWRRWHITLSRFLRDYLYIPLGGNRYGAFYRYRNLIITMLLGGFWHGASWTFIVWGGLHGIYLSLNHVWRGCITQSRFKNAVSHPSYKFIAWLLTFIVVVIAWVFFRANTLHAAINMIHSMFGGVGFSITNQFLNHSFLYYLSIAGMISFIFPNTQQLFAKYNPGLETYPGDITPVRFLNRIDWLAFIKPRFIGYIWGSYAISIGFMALFYFTNLEARLFQYYPITNRPRAETNMVRGDYRTNLFINDIFVEKARKVAIVGSCYTSRSGNFDFVVNGVHYHSGPVGNDGYSLANGFRAAAVILNNFKVDTIIFGVSPIGFGKIRTASVFFKNQCMGSLNQLGFDFPIVPFQECTPMSFHIQELAEIALQPGDKKFQQFDGFLYNLLKPDLGDVLQPPIQFSLYKMHQYNQWYEALKNEKPHSYAKLNIQYGNNTKLRWLHRGILESMDLNGDVYIAFKNLKQLADAKRVKLVVYNAPTVSFEDAPYIYPKGFLQAYQTKLAELMHTLHIPYFNFGKQMIWDDRYTEDYIHTFGKVRTRIHAHLINDIFYKGKENHNEVY